MKNKACLLLSILFLFLCVGCSGSKTKFVFDDFGIEVKMQIDETISVSQDNNTMLISNIKNDDAIGVISVAKEERKNIDEICDTYIIGDGERTKTELSDNLIFVEIINKVDSVILDERVDKMYCFIFYDKNEETVLYGRFFENSERDSVISLAKSIEVVKK